MEKQNPFVFGKVVRGTDFCNRKEEIQKIKGILDKNGEYNFNDPLFKYFITDFTKLF